MALRGCKVSAKESDGVGSVGRIEAGIYGSEQVMSLIHIRIEDSGNPGERSVIRAVNMYLAGVARTVAASSVG